MGRELACVLVNVCRGLHTELSTKQKHERQPAGLAPLGTGQARLVLGMTMKCTHTYPDVRTHTHTHTIFIPSSQV